MKYTLKNWYLSHWPGDEYKAPECRATHLRGQIYGRETQYDGSFEDGHNVITSRAIDFAVHLLGWAVHTKSGSTYLLSGPPDPEWVSWLKEIGKEPNPNNPLLVRDIEEENHD